MLAAQFFLIKNCITTIEDNYMEVIAFIDNVLS